MVLATRISGPYLPARPFPVEEPVQPIEESDRRGVAERVRALIGSGGDPDLTIVASRLRVDEAALAATVDVDAPLPDMEVLVAVIREYGVDVTWLLTGEYDLATHRLSAEADRAKAIEVVKDVVRRHDASLDPPVPPPDDNPSGEPRPEL